MCLKLGIRLFDQIQANFKIALSIIYVAKRGAKEDICARAQHPGDAKTF